MADQNTLNQAYSACPTSPNSVFATNADIDAYCSCVSSIEAQRLGLSMTDLEMRKGQCASSFVSDRRMWRWVGAGLIGLGAWAVLRRKG